MIQNLLAQAKAARAIKRKTTGAEHNQATIVHAGICYDLDKIYRRSPAIAITAEKLTTAIGFA